MQVLRADRFRSAETRLRLRKLSISQVTNQIARTGLHGHAKWLARRPVIFNARSTMHCDGELNTLWPVSALGKLQGSLVLRLSDFAPQRWFQLVRSAANYRY